MYMKINGSWIDLTEVYMKVDGEWVRTKYGYMKINGEWVGIQGLEGIKAGDYISAGMWQDQPYGGSPGRSFGFTTNGNVTNGSVYVFNNPYSHPFNVYNSRYSVPSHNRDVLATGDSSAYYMYSHMSWAYDVGNTIWAYSTLGPYPGDTIMYNKITNTITHQGACPLTVAGTTTSGALYPSFLDGCNKSIDKYTPGTINYLITPNGPTNNVPSSNSFYIHDTLTNTWTNKTTNVLMWDDYNSLKYTPTIAYDLKDTIYMFQGSWSSASYSTPQLSTLLYNITTDTFSIGPNYLNYPTAMIREFSHPSGTGLGLGGYMEVKCVFDGEDNIFILISNRKNPGIAMWSYNLTLRNWFQHPNVPYTNWDSLEVINFGFVPHPTNRKLDRFYFNGTETNGPWYYYTNFRA